MKFVKIFLRWEMAMTTLNTQNLIDLTLTLSIVAMFISAIVMKSKKNLKKVPILVKNK